jgi:basic membrane protein A
VHGNDVGGGFKEGWVEMRESNDILVPENVRRAIVNTIKALEDNTLDVFKGDYIGVNPDNPDDTIDLTHKFEENANSSAPTFNYILKDVIEIVE